MGTHKHAAVAVESSATTTDDAADDAAALGEAAAQSGAERRRAHRLLVDLEVDYQCEDNYLFAYICDISSTGIFVRTTAPHPPGTRLNLRFAPPPPASVTARMRALSAPGHETTAPSRPSAAVLARTVDADADDDDDDDDDDELRNGAVHTIRLHDGADDAADPDDLHDPWARKHPSNSNEPARRPSAVVLDVSPIEVEGEVIWTNPFRPDDKDNTHPGMGIRFSPLDDVTRQRLLELIRRIAYLPEL
ncbi:MAG: PilZ domain-containing protein [Kofleriaceae bacterium]|nr:PilZ domain-containing protein [Kofleriaceae bacterium]